MMDDDAILHEQVSFIEAPLLKDDQHEIFVQPAETVESATLFEHCRLAIQKGLKLGERGLPLMGSGDWNDGMNRVGIEGKGESIWMGWFLADVLRNFAVLCQRLGREEEAEGYLGRATQLASKIEDHAWDGDWYLRAFFDNGTPLGSRESEEAHIDSLSQSWAAISGFGDPKRTDQALASARKELVREDDRLVLLFTPPFDRWDADPGYIKSYPPGVRENGGQYTHAATWLAKAFAMRGKAEEAVKILDLLNPITHALDSEAAHRYRIEPYVIAADIYQLDGHVGMGGWSWYTGAASWYYRVWVEDVLGLSLSGSTLSLNPNIPETWEGFKLAYRFGRAVFEIEVTGCGPVESIEMDGRRIEGLTIPLEDDGAKHRVLVKLGARSSIRS
jgi:cyclic beta-1,2-glucan synthetase